MSWKSEIKALLKQSWSPGELFTLADVYRFEPLLSQKHQGNAHIREKLRQVLQQLRDEGVVGFINGRGFYVMLAPEGIRGADAVTAFYPDEVIEPSRYIEGATRAVAVNAFERNARARQACIDHYGARCIVCGFDFKNRYGVRGEGYIHVHHLVPLADIGTQYVVDPVADLRPVCPNCHAMIHRTNPPLAVEKLSALIRHLDGRE